MTDIERFRKHALEEWGLIIDVVDDGSIRDNRVWKATLMEAPGGAEL